MSNGLGRGLNSLIPQKVNKTTNVSSGKSISDNYSFDDKNKILQLSLEKIKTNPYQPRKHFDEAELMELINSIKEHGIIQPLIVTSSGGGFYELVAGERRLRAARFLKLETVPVIVRDADNLEKLELALIENIQREDLNAIEKALAYQRLVDEFNLTHDEIAKKVSKSRPVVSNTLRLLNLPQEIQVAIIEGRISEGHAKIIAGLDNEDKQIVMFKRVLQGNLNVADTLKEARHMGGTKQSRIKVNYTDKDKEFIFREFFGSRAEIKRSGKGGQIIIHFFSDDELDMMVKKIKNF